MSAGTMNVRNNYDFRDGSIVAHVQLRFKKGVSSPLQPLDDQVKTGTLGPFRVTGGLILNPSMCARCLHCFDTYNLYCELQKKKKRNIAKYFMLNFMLTVLYYCHASF